MCNRWLAAAVVRTRLNAYLARELLERGKYVRLEGKLSCFCAVGRFHSEHLARTLPRRGRWVWGRSKRERPPTRRVLYHLRGRPRLRPTWPVFGLRRLYSIVLGPPVTSSSRQKYSQNYTQTTGRSECYSFLKNDSLPVAMHDLSEPRPGPHNCNL